MKVKYFSDTDTALVEFTDREVAETREISENIYADLDKVGNLVSMTIEHARDNARLDEFSLVEITKGLNIVLTLLATVIPAKAGIQVFWAPVFTGVTNELSFLL